MKMYLLKESDGYVLGVITTETSTEKEIQAAMDIVKEKDLHIHNELDDVIKILPSDCKFYNTWNNVGTIRY